MNKNKKIAPWRLIVGFISIAYIVYMWAKKNILASFIVIPQGDALPFIVTTIFVALLKVIAIAGVVLLIKWIINKIKSK